MRNLGLGVRAPRHTAAVSGDGGIVISKGKPLFDTKATVS